MQHVDACLKSSFKLIPFNSILIFCKYSIMFFLNQNAVPLCLQGFYKRSDNYMTIFNREELGLFPVPMVHSCLLIDLRFRVSTQLSYTPPKSVYDGVKDDIIGFAHSVKAVGMEFSLLFSFVLFFLSVCHSGAYFFSWVPL